MSDSMYTAINDIDFDKQRLKRIFGDEALDKAKKLMSVCGSVYLEGGVHNKAITVCGLAERQPEYKISHYDDEDACDAVGKRWSETIKLMRDIDVKEPEITFLLSDLAVSGTWKLLEGIQMHGSDVIADIINTLSKNGTRGNYDLLRLTDIIISDDPFVDACKEGIGYEFGTEKLNQSLA